MPCCKKGTFSPPPIRRTTTDDMPSLTGESPIPRRLSPPPLLLTATDCTDQIHLVIGNNPLAGARCSRSLEAGAKVKLIAPEMETLNCGLQRWVDDGEVEWIRREFSAEDLTTLGRDEVDNVVDMVFVTLSVECAQCAYISSLCKRMRIPVNVVDAPMLCSFTLLSTHSDGSLQIGVTTAGNGCKLANRIRREIAATLPEGLGQTCDKLGTLRRTIIEADGDGGGGGGDEDDSTDQKSTFNALVRPDDPAASKTRRIRWLSQICEYWPLQKLCDLTHHDIESLLQDYVLATSGDAGGGDAVLDPVSDEMLPVVMDSSNTTPPSRKKGTIQLVGAGPGHPHLLTTASIKAIQSADLILADKLVPSSVLDLVPRRSTLYIAKKFPGNADKAQEELLELGLKGAKEGLRVVRLKQGDPYIYGRGAEEYEFFERNGFRPVVLPGISSAMSAPLFAAIPATHRGIADQLLVCTGTGRKGAQLDPPPYVQSRTTVFLMALHRLKSLIESLVLEHAYPKDLPCAVIERASCPDQRVIRTTLEYVVAAVEEEGSRPPGLLVVGWACNVLKPMQERKKWVVEEGFRDF